MDLVLVVEAEVTLRVVVVAAIQVAVVVVQTAMEPVA